MVEVGLGIPVAVGEENVGVVLVLPELKVSTAWKIPDRLLPLFEKSCEGFYVFGFEGHLYNA